MAFNAQLYPQPTKSKCGVQMNNVGKRIPSAYSQPEAVCFTPVESFDSQSQGPPVVYIYSRHFLARKAIESALGTDHTLKGSICPEPQTAQCAATADKPQVPIVDICSVENWPELVSRWTTLGSLPVALLPPDHAGYAEQLKALYMGVRGIVTLSTNLEQELPKAVHSVASGRLWICRDILNEYVRQTTLLSSQLPAQAKRFTAREDQVVKFIIRGFSNKQIASLLGTSERTVKFHVSNILQKAGVHSREGLLQKLAPFHGANPGLSLLP
jgi:DNA-binding NarL/FixJ family response regulator